MHSFADHDMIAWMKLSIRRAVSSDADGIARVHVSTWRDAYPTLLPPAYLTKSLSEAGQTSSWRNRLRRRGETVLVAEDDQNRILGYIAFGLCRRPRRDRIGEIYELYVSTSEQDRGIGRALLIGARRHMNDAGIRSAIVEVLSENPARYFYERMGASIGGTAKRSFSGQKLETTIYVWKDITRLVDN